MLLPRAVELVAKVSVNTNGTSCCKTATKNGTGTCSVSTKTVKLQSKGNNAKNNGTTI